MPFCLGENRDVLQPQKLVICMGKGLSDEKYAEAL